MLNAERAKAGLPGLSLNDQLDAAAQGHAFDMVRMGFFDHASPNGARPSDRVTAQGYRWCHVAENIAMASRAKSGCWWLGWRARAHRRNNLSRQAKEYGFGHAGDVWVLVVASGC